MESQNFEFRITKCNDERRAKRGEPACNADKDAIDTYVKDVQVDAWAVYEKVNFQIRDGKPTFRVMDVQGTYVYDDKHASQVNFYLSKQVCETKDSYFYLGQYSYKGYFYNIGKMVPKQLIKQGLDEISEETKEIIFSSVTWLNNESTKFSRQVYNIFDLLGDLGGVTEVIMITFGFFLFSVSEHSFHMTAIKKLFFVRTKDETLFGT